MHHADGDRLAALLHGADLTTARAALARAAGSELSGLAYLVLQNRSAAEAAAAAAIGAAVRRAETTAWRLTGPELNEHLVAGTLAAALRRYDRTREIDPLEPSRPSAVPAEPLARAVVAAVLVAGLPVAAAARAAGIRERRARRLIRDAAATAGSESRLRAAMTAQAATVPLSVSPPDVETEQADAPSDRRRWLRATPPVALAGAAAAILLVAVASGPRPEQAGVAATVSPRPTAAMKGPPPVAAEAGVLPTLESCGIGPPDAPLAYAGWLSVEQLGAAPPDAVAGEPFYALVPAGEVAWNPPGLSRRIMPPVRGRLACISTVSGLPPTVVGLPAAWAPPPIPRHQLVTLADCRLRPADARIAYRGWLTTEQLGEPVPRPLYAIVTEGRVSRVGPTREQKARFACTIDPETEEPRAIVLPADWESPRID